MRIFMSTGEASGDMSAAALAGAIRALRGDAEFSGIGGERMRAAGFDITADTRGWASMGPVEAVAKIPPLYVVMWRHALALRVPGRAVGQLRRDVLAEQARDMLAGRRQGVIQGGGNQHLDDGLR